MLEIRNTHNVDHAAWDQYVLSRTDHATYLTSAWRRAVEAGYGNRTYYLGAFEQGSLFGVLPLVLVRLPLSRGRLVSLPYCDYGGLLASSSDAADALLCQAIALARRLSAGLEVRGVDSHPALTQHGGFCQVTNKCRMVLELPGSSARLWQGFRSKLRSQVKSAVKNGLTCALGRDELLPDFYEVFCRNMRDLGSPVHSSSWLRSVLASFGTHARVGIVYKGPIAVASGIILTQGNQTSIPWASSLREFNRLNPNMLLYWTFLEYAADNGASFFDFGRSTPGEGTYEFKKQWGAQPVPLHWFAYGRRSPRRSRFHVTGVLQSAAEGIWRKLPLTIANAAGPSIRRFVSL